MLRVPGTGRRASSIRAPIRPITARSSPCTFKPTGVRMPVVSISMRPFTGMVQALDRPGSLRASSNWPTSSSCEM